MSTIPDTIDDIERDLLALDKDHQPVPGSFTTFEMADNHRSKLIIFGIPLLVYLLIIFFKKSKKHRIITVILITLIIWGVLYFMGEFKIDKTFTFF